MPSNSLTASSSSSSTVAGQQSPALKASHDTVESSTSSPIISYDYDFEPSTDIHYEYDYESSPPETPGLFWDSRPSSAELVNSSSKSVFENFQDDVVNIASLPIVIEEDGAQTLLIPPESQFYVAPSPINLFGFALFSNDQHDAPDIKPTFEIDEAPIFAIEPDMIIKKDLNSHQHLDCNTNRPAPLILDTSFHQQYDHELMLLSSVFSTPALRAADDASWAPKGFMRGPDVPLDCIYNNGGDVSPMTEHWEEPWSPVVVSPFRSAPFA